MAVDARSIVLLPMITCVAPEARLTGVPDTVIDGAPGISVWPSMM